MRVLWSQVTNRLQRLVPVALVKRLCLDRLAFFCDLLRSGRKSSVLASFEPPLEFFFPRPVLQCVQVYTFSEQLKGGRSHVLFDFSAQFVLTVR